MTSSLVAGVTVFYLSFKLGPVGIVIGLSMSGLIYVVWCGLLALKSLRKEEQAAI